MSYILDALRRSEQERNLNNVPTLSMIQGEPTPVGFQHKMRWGIVAALLISLSVAALYKEDATRWIKSLSADLPSPSMAGMLEPVKNMADSLSETISQTIATKSTNSANHITASGSGEDLGAKENGQQSTMSSVSGASNEVDDTVQTFNSIVQPQATAPGGENAVFAAADGADSVAIDSASETEFQPQAPETESTAVSVSISEDLPNGFPSLALNALSYSDNPARRFAMINQQIFHEGEPLEQGAELVEITDEGIIVQYNQREYLLRP